MRLLKYIISHVFILLLLIIALVCDIPALLADLSVWIQKQTLRLNCWSTGHSYDLFGTLLIPLSEIKCLNCNNSLPSQEYDLVQAQRNSILSSVTQLSNHINDSNELVGKLG